jgi:FkbM family methyltransferase
MNILKRYYRKTRYFFSSRTSYAQHGEDLVLESFFDYHKKTGFYVDIGAHHPYRFSNTRLFYKKGWRGINIDAMPGSMKSFRFFRRRDINLEMGVGLQKGTLKFYSFEEPAYNTFSEHLVNDPEFLKRVPLKKIYEVPVITLVDLLEKHLPANTHIDFLSIDAEGFDLDILKSNDWSRFRPTYLLVEEGMNSIRNISETGAFLEQQQYQLVARTCITSLYAVIETTDAS